MKLRVRSLESKENLKIDLPNPSTFHQLKQSIFYLINRCSSSSSSFDDIHVSLNRKDELEANSPNDSLQSLGITSGDLLYFTLNPNVFVKQSLILPETLVSDQLGDVGLKNQIGGLNSNGFLEKTLIVPETLVSNDVKSQNECFKPTGVSKQTLASDELRDIGAQIEKESSEFVTADQTPFQFQSEAKRKMENLVQSETLGLVESSSQNSKIEDPNLTKIAMNEVALGEEMMESSDSNHKDSEMMDVDKKSLAGHSEFPSFLSMVYREVVDDNCTGWKLFVISVQAVMLESGFVGFDLSSRKKVDGFHLPDGLNMQSSTICLWYTIPNLLASSKSNSIETVVLKIQSFGKYVNVFGSLVQNGSALYRLCVDESRFVPCFSSLWEKRHEMVDTIGAGDILPQQVFEFWKMFKDGLALPLLMDLCEKTDLVPPMNLMRLPTELKLVVLQFLPGTDLAKIGIACRKFRSLSSNDELWKQKFVEEFGSAATAAGGLNWKEKFAIEWEARKKIRGDAARFGFYHRLPTIIRDPNPRGFPGVIGGEYDRYPAFGFGSPLAQPRFFLPQRPGQTGPRFRRGRNFSPPCNLGGFNI